ncbi:histidinol-phosphate transaminase [Ferrovum sp. PN-J185]|uniref:histidinol-phosphate transaminase n=1 Tax=Ferrovum sp. PN-J185 TaxID=1356306 RepID=UPI001E546C5D|nr:histidinol-phosphate transaminase [Ferrovum sp. PN-J185]MCC6068249.1 histidinol-phosphate transaminase [Ferrovum sp. PN-J185]
MDCIRPEIRALSAYHVPPAQGLIKLDAMENPYSLTPELQQILAMSLQSVALNRYPDPNASLIKEEIRRIFTIHEDASIVLGNGSDEIIQMIALAVAKPNGVLLGVDPSFVMFKMIATFVGMNYVGVPLNADFSLDKEAILSAIEKHQPEVIFLAYPNNPTGNCFDEETLLAVIKASDKLVVIDEAYFPFTDHSMLSRLMQFPNLVVMRTLSKLGLAGVRLGFLAGPKHIVDEINKVRLPYNISVLDQQATLVLLKHYDVFKAQTSQIRQERTRLYNEIAQLKQVQLFHSEANFLLLKINNAQDVFNRILERGILIKNLTNAHPSLTDCLRVTVGSFEENTLFLNALKSSLN